MTTSIELPIVEIRRRNHPVHKGVQRFDATVQCSEYPEDLPLDANPRDSRGNDLNKRVYKEVRDSLLGRTSFDGTFDLMSRGIVLIAKKVDRIDDETYRLEFEDGQGVVDGGHLNYTILENQGEEELSESQFVNLTIFTGLDSVSYPLIPDIAKGLNTSLQVKDHTIENLKQHFEWLKEIVDKEPYGEKVSWREGEPGDYDVRDLIAIIEALNVIDFPNHGNKHPYHAYEKWSKALNEFAKDAHDGGKKYQAFAPILKQALWLFDRIRHDFYEMHNSMGGRAGKMRIVEQARPGREFSFDFAPDLDATEYRLHKGATFPIFAAFRNLVEQKDDGTIQWKGGFQTVLKLWEGIGPELVLETYSATRDIGHTPDLIGKSRSHWMNLHKSVQLHVLREELEQGRKKKKKG